MGRLQRSTQHSSQKPTFAVLLAKQRFISSILLCAFSVLFAHSVVPHQHHEEATATHQSNHHDDLDNNFLEQAFSHFQHDSNSGITYETASPIFQCSEFAFTEDAILFTQYVIRPLSKPPLKHKEHSSYAFIPSNYSASRLFRGPPMA